MKTLRCGLVVAIGFLILTLPAAASADLTDGLVGYWPFNGNANDESGNNNDATVFGAMLAPDRFGIPNSAYSFDGASDFIRTPVLSQLTGDEITLSAWVKLDRRPNDAAQIIEANLGSVGEIFLETGSGNRVDFRVLSSHQVSRTSLQVGEWTHVAGTASLSSLKIYINGGLDAGTSSPSLTLTPVSFAIGKDDEGDIQYWPGLIDDIRIYNRALSDSEIELLYNENPDAICDNNTNHCYQRFDDTMSWHMAQNHCESNGAYLLTINSQGEQDFVFNNLLSDSPNDVWVGGSDEATEGTWQWVTGESWAYTNWRSGEPDNCGGLEHYAAMDAADGLWNDTVSLNNGSGTCTCPVVFESISAICEWGEILGDVNGDNKVNAEDYQEFRRSFGRCSGSSGFNARADYDEDGCVTYSDFWLWYGYVPR